ncbi:hypothetical protein [Streptomyces monomycini]|uniref:hypothetical protein n=1 Tax=Streptomyces monomycini TaxID=371720 RepID=UPI001EEA8F58|nr:hypothetical protein [Streptomyces monomycini]
MIHVRHHHTVSFTVVGNHLALNPMISTVALGYAVRVQAMPDGATVSIRKLANTYKETEYVIGKALKELEDEGYLVRERIRIDGQRIVTRTTYYENPKDRLRSTDPTPPQQRQAPPPPPPAPSPPPPPRPQPVDIPEPPRTDTAVAPEEPDALEAIEGSEAIQVTELSEAPEPEAPATCEKAEATEASAASETLETPKSPEVPGVPEMPGAPETPEAPAANEVPPPPQVTPQPQAAPSAQVNPPPQVAPTAQVPPSPQAPPPPRTPGAPPAAPPALIPSPAADLLCGLRLADERLTLSVRDVNRLAPAVSAWLDRGVSAAYVVHSLVSTLPPGAIGHPASFLKYRLTEKLPPPLPVRPPEGPGRVRATGQECQICGLPFAAPTGSPATAPAPSSALVRCPRCRTAEEWTAAAPRPAALRNVQAPTRLRTGAAASGRTPAARARSAAARALPR